MSKRKPEPKAVVSLHKQCSYPMREDAVAASDNCNRLAVSLVHSRETGHWLYRCREHRGEVRFGVYGRVRYQMPEAQVPEVNRQPDPKHSPIRHGPGPMA